MRPIAAKLASLTASLLAVAAALAVGASGASAASPWWNLTSSVRPSVLQRGGGGLVGVRVLNVGDAPANGEGCEKVAAGAGKFTNSECTESGLGEYEKTPIVITATLPAGLTVQKVPRGAGEPEEPKVTLNTFPESESAAGEKCTEPAPGQVQCTFEGSVLPYTYVEASIAVKVESEVASGGASVAEVSGGEAPPAKTKRSVIVGSPGQGVPFGVEGFSIVPEEEGGRVQAQAGAHPFQLTTTFALNQTEHPLEPPALPKNLTFTLPPGLVANAVGFPRCSELDFLTKGHGKGLGDECPQNTAVGVIMLESKESFFTGPAPTATYPVPVFNLAPKQGEPVRFGFYLAGIAVPIDFSIRTGADYGALGTVGNITQITSFVAESLTIWGVPGEPVHNHSRGWGCLAEGFYEFLGQPECLLDNEAHPPPFLTLPTSCATPFAASVNGESWPRKAGPEAEAKSVELPEASYSLQDGFGRPIGLTGCARLPFDPSIEVSPDVQQASTSTGLTVDVRVPQEVSENAGGLASSSVRDITVALPEGVAVNPSGGNGLEACSNALIGYQGKKTFSTVPGTELLAFSPRLPGSAAALEAGESAAFAPGVNFCADAAKIGTVEIHTPLLADPLKGSVYLAGQNENPFGSLIATYVVAEDPISGVLVKLPGVVHLSEAGQIVSTFENNPQLPFEEAELHFFGGERAPLATPSRCRENNQAYPGLYTTTASFTPWSGTDAVDSTSAFAITSGPNGSPCPGASLPFDPSLTGGTTNNNAGAFSSLTTTIGREDGRQNVQSVTLHLPPGLSGLLSNVKLCPEQQANEGTCGQESLIGETTVSAGVGSDPVSVKGGKVYITEKYAGAPYGLSVVNPVKAGPLDLEHDTSNPNQQPPCDCVVVRAKLEVNPTTAALTVTTDPSGPHAIPHVIDGVPVQIRKVNVLITRPNFTFNPTNCNPTQITGAITSDEGATSPVSVPFQATNCAVLKFAPKFQVSTSAKTSKVAGASLTATLSYPPNSLGVDANIAKAKFDLPKQLPSRLTTLQKACLAVTFEANPAACPAASIVGHAKVTTPVLPIPLEGPAYFVSHGNEAFPSLTMVLQGDGVTIDLVGSTLIHNGITSTTFKQTPDQPFNTFQLVLPQGPYSALAANADLCKSKLQMPTAFVAQNGAEIKQNTKIAITGCPKVKAKKVTKRHKAKKGHKAKGSAKRGRSVS